MQAAKYELTNERRAHGELADTVKALHAEMAARTQKAAELQQADKVRVTADPAQT